MTMLEDPPLEIPHTAAPSAAAPPPAAPMEIPHTAAPAPQMAAPAHSTTMPAPAAPQHFTPTQSDLDKAVISAARLYLYQTDPSTNAHYNYDVTPPQSRVADKNLQGKINSIISAGSAARFARDTGANPNADDESAIAASIAGMTPQEKYALYVPLHDAVREYHDKRVQNEIAAGTALESDYEPSREEVMQQAKQYVEDKKTGRIAANASIFAQGLSQSARAVVDPLRQVVVEGTGGAVTTAEERRREEMFNRARNMAMQDKFPYSTGISSMAGRMLSPESLAVMAGTGGISAAPEMAALGLAGRVAGHAAAGATLGEVQSAQNLQAGEPSNFAQNVGYGAAAGAVGGVTSEAAGVAMRPLAPAIQAIGKPIAGAAIAGGTNVAIGELQGGERTSKQRLQEFLAGAAPALFAEVPGIPESYRQAKAIQELQQAHGFSAKEATQFIADVQSANEADHLRAIDVMNQKLADQDVRDAYAQRNAEAAKQKEQDRHDQGAAMRTYKPEPTAPEVVKPPETTMTPQAQLREQEQMRDARENDLQRMTAAAQSPMEIPHAQEIQNVRQQSPEAPLPSNSEPAQVHPGVREEDAQAPARAVAPPQEQGGEVARPPALQGEGQVGFKTSQGSTYAIDEQGRTTRNKSPHILHDASDVGVKEQSQKTVYVSPESASAIGMHGSLSGEKQIIDRDGKLYAVAKNPQGQWGISPSEKAGHEYTTTPEIGKHPVELWANGRKWHAGSAITEISPKAAPLEIPHNSVQTEPVPGIVKATGETNAPPPTSPDVRSLPSSEGGRVGQRPTPAGSPQPNDVGSGSRARRPGIVEALQRAIKRYRGTTIEDNGTDLHVVMPSGKRIKHVLMDRIAPRSEQEIENYIDSAKAENDGAKWFEHNGTDYHIPSDAAEWNKLSEEHKNAILDTFRATGRYDHANSEIHTTDRVTKDHSIAEEEIFHAHAAELRATDRDTYNRMIARYDNEDAAFRGFIGSKESRAEYFERIRKGTTHVIDAETKAIQAKLDKSQMGETGSLFAVRKVSDAGASKETIEDARKQWEEKGTDSPYFKKWFGESKVVDAEGKPLVVYHGTNETFNKFSRSKSAMAGIFWVTSDRGSIERGESGAAGTKKIMPLYASIKNPAGWNEYENLSIGELRGRGYDGVILPNKDGHFDAIIFDANQLKSSEKNRGTFESSNSDIRFAVRKRGADEPSNVQPKPETPEDKDTRPAATLFGQYEQSPTGIRNRETDKMRENLGLSAAAPVMRRAYADEVMTDARAEYDANPNAGHDLSAQLRDKPRPVTDTEDAILTMHQVELQTQHAKAAKELVDAKAKGDDATAAAKRIQEAALSDKLLEHYNLTREVGTANARGLAARRIMMNEDYSLAAMETRARAARGGEALTPKEKEIITEQAAKIASLQKQIEENAKNAEARVRKARANAATDKIIAEGQAANPGKTRTAARRESILAGIRQLVASSKQGLGAKFAVRSEGEPSPESAHEIEQPANDYSSIPGLGKALEALAKTHVEEGIRDREKLLDLVHDETKDALPGMSRSDKMDAISGYGKYKQLSKDEIAVAMRDLKGQMQQVGKLEDMQAGQPPSKTGVERRTPSDEERRLIQQVNETKKRLNIQTTDPETQLKSALQSRKTAITNQIKDLEYQIAKGEKTVKNKTPGPSDAELETLKAKRDQLHEEFYKIFGKPDITEEQRMAAAVKSAQRAADEAEARVKAGELITPGKPKMSSPELEAARARRDAANAELKNLRDSTQWYQDMQAQKSQAAKIEAMQARIDANAQRIAAGDVAAKKTPGTPDSPELAALRKQNATLNATIAQMREAANPTPKKTPEEIALAAFKNRTLGRMAELADKMVRGDYGAPEPRKPLALDPEATKLQATLNRFKQAYDDGNTKARYANRSFSEKAQDYFTAWRRMAILSGESVIAKLSAAATARIGIAPFEEGVGGALSKVPGLSKIARQAPREGGFNTKAEVSALTSVITKGMPEAWKKLTTGHSDMDAIYGKMRPASPTPAWMEFFGRLHGALKEPVRQSEWARSFEKRMQWNARNGVDVSDPIQQMRIGKEAYEDSNRAIFMQDNWLASKITNFIRAPKDPTVGQKAFETVGKTLLPITKVPTNIVAEAGSYAFGTVTGSVKAGVAFAKGIESLKPEQADSIMRSLKKGSLGAAAMGLGYFGAGSIGGFYQRGEKRNEDDPAAGGAKVFGVRIPPLLMHHPLFEVLNFGATIRRVADSWHKGDQRGNVEGAAAAAFGLMEEVPFVRETADIQKMADPNTRNKALADQAKSIVIPAGVQQPINWMHPKPPAVTTKSEIDAAKEKAKYRDEGAFQFSKMSAQEAVEYLEKNPTNRTQKLRDGYTQTYASEALRKVNTSPTLRGADGNLTTEGKDLLKRLNALTK